MPMHTERDIVEPILSVCPSVCPMLVLCLNVWTYRRTFFGNVVRALFQFFFDPTAVTKFQGNLLSRALNKKAWEKLANIALYLGNGTR